MSDSNPSTGEQRPKDAAKQPTTSDSRPEQPKQRKPPRSPRFLTAVTLLVVVGFAAAFFFNSEIEDAFGVPLDVLNVFALLSYLLLSLLWVLWIAILSRWDISTRIMSVVAIFLVPYTALRVFNPVFGGDMTIVGWQPIWEAPREIPKADEETSAGLADLTIEAETDFPQFLGPNRNGIIQTKVPVDLAGIGPESITWKIPMGPGWSGFVARNGFAVTMEQRQDQECVTCYQISDGKLIWIYQHKARHQDALNLGHVGPRSTPTIHNGMVYAVGANGNFVCLKGTNGSIVWQVDLNNLLGLKLKQTSSGKFATQAEDQSALEWGRSGSPLIHGDCVIVPGGGPKGGPNITLIAFDLLTGDVKWQGGKEMIGYGSPSLQTVDGTPQILMMAESKGMSFDPATGDVLWTVNRPGNSSGEANTSQMTAITDNTVLLSKGYNDGGGTLLEVNRKADEWEVKELWTSPRVLKTKLTSPVIKDGHAYSICNGFLECARLSDGKRIWKHRGRLGHGQLLLVNDTLVVHSEFGELFIVDATPDGYKEIANVKTVDGICWNVLCLAGDKLLVRSDQEAACLQLTMDVQASTE